MTAPDWQAPGRSRVSAFIVVPDALRVADFAKQVFGAQEVRPPLFRKSGALWNYELNIGESTIMLGDAQGDMHQTAFLYVHVEDAAATYEKALIAGAHGIMPPQDQFYGDFDGGVQDMAGNMWWISTHKYSLSHDEMLVRAQAQENDI